jgi:transcriptional regulator with XRE-family HTH domain
MKNLNIPFTITGLRKVGLTQAQIGGEIGVSQTSVSDMQNGVSGIKRPSANVENGLKKLAKKYRVPMVPPPP